MVVLGGNRDAALPSLVQGGRGSHGDFRGGAVVLVGGCKCFVHCKDNIYTEIADLNTS